MHPLPVVLKVITASWPAVVTNWPSKPVQAKTNSPAAGVLPVQNVEPVSPDPMAPTIGLGLGPGTYASPALSCVPMWMLNPDQPSVAAAVFTGTVFVETVPSEMVPPTPAAETGSSSINNSAKPAPPASSNPRTRFTRASKHKPEIHLAGMLPRLYNALR